MKHGYIPTDEAGNMLTDFEQPHLESYGQIKSSYHFKDRLFDRDTLFVHPYQLNFLFILNSYTKSYSLSTQNFIKNTKEQFRANFIDFFNSKEQSGFEFFEKPFSSDAMEKFVHQHFKLLNGRCIRIHYNEKLLIALPNEDNSKLKKLLVDFKKIQF